MPRVIQPGEASQCVGGGGGGGDNRGGGGVS